MSAPEASISDTAECRSPWNVRGGSSPPGPLRGSPCSRVPDGGGGMSGQNQEDLNEKARRYREGEQSAPPNGHREPSEKLSPQHRRELEASAIDQAVWEE